MTAPSEALQALHQQARALLTQLHPLAAQAPSELQSTWAQYLGRLEELTRFLAVGGSAPLVLPAERAVSKAQWAEFGRLLRDKRTAAGLSRVQLARRAKLSDATLKFAETARHPPSRTTLIRLIAVAELKLRWADVPGRPALPAPEPSDPPRLEEATLLGSLNCLLAPSYDPLSLVADLARFLNGAGGYLEQTSAYLDTGSAAAYLALCQNWLLCTTLRSRLPLGEIAQQIVAAGGRGPLLFRSFLFLPFSFCSSSVDISHLNRRHRAKRKSANKGPCHLVHVRAPIASISFSPCSVNFLGS